MREDSYIPLLQVFQGCLKSGERWKFPEWFQTFCQYHMRVSSMNHGQRQKLNRGSRIQILKRKKQIGQPQISKRKETNPAFQGSKHHMCRIKTVDKVGRERRSLFHAIHYRTILSNLVTTTTKTNKPSALAFGSEIYTDWIVVLICLRIIFL